MRSINKGSNAAIYLKYGDATPDLIARIGCFCSYCEMEISNEPDLEHVAPKTRGGALLAWENFLLGCKRCNKIKSARNPSRASHLWPDEDNTSLAYVYSNEIQVNPSARVIGTTVEALARNTLSLTGIDRLPFRSQRPSKAARKDRRWQKRREVWGKAERALQNWRGNPSNQLCETIADLAHSSGFYSIWMQFFAGEPTVLAAIKARFPGTYEPLPNPLGGFVVRSGGRF